MKRWTRQERALIRARYPTERTADLASELGVSACAVRVQASRMRLRKSLAYLIQRAREGRRQPLGTERLRTSYKSNGIVMVKVSNKGTQTEQWRPKHHLIWSQANGKNVPPGFRVIFKDGNKQNLDPGNLELATRDEISAQAFAKFRSYPPPLQDAIRLTCKLQSEIVRRRAGQV